MVLNGMGNAIPFQRRGMAGLGELTDAGSPALQEITTAVRDLVTLYNQQQIMEANIDRAARGLPPLNTAQIAPQYNIGLASDTKNMLVMGGLLLLGVYLLSNMGGRRR